MKARVTALQQQAADYVLNQLSDRERDFVQRRLALDVAMRREVKSLSEAAAAISLTAPQVLPPENEARKLLAKVASAAKSDADTPSE